MNVIITGATGMVGKGVLLECLDHPDISKVLTISRKSIGLSHDKLTEVLHQDFSEFDSIAEQLKGYDACYHCMGVSAAGKNESQYTLFTHSYTLALAKTVLDQNKEITFTYVSGVGTDSSEKGRVMWARVKGKTENDLLDYGFKAAFMYRPGGIIPLRGIKSSTRLYQFIYDYFMWLLRLIKWVSPSSVVNTTQIGLSMINVTKHGYEKIILEPGDILKSAE